MGDPRNISILSRSCSPHLEHLSIICRPFYLPREFSAVIATAVLHSTSGRHELGFVQTPRRDQRLQSTNTLTLPLSSQGTLTKPTSGRSCRTSISMYPAQLEDRIHWIIATLSSRMPNKARSLPAFGKSDHAAIFLTPEYKQRIVQESPG